MKKDLKESELQKRLNRLRTSRKLLLDNYKGDNKEDVIRRLRKFKRYLVRLERSWILSGHSRDLIDRFIEVIQEDIRSS